MFIVCNFVLIPKPGCNSLSLLPSFVLKTHPPQNRFQSNSILSERNVFIFHIHTPTPCFTSSIFTRLRKYHILLWFFVDVESLMSKVETTLTECSDNQTFYDVMSTFVSQSRDRISELEATLDATKEQ